MSKAMRRAMLRPIWFIATSALLASALASCSASAEPSQTLRVTGVDDKSSVVMRVGDTLQVSLEGNPTTGYQWEVTGVDATILKASGEPQYKPTSAALGAGGQVTFLFEALAAGQTSLEMAYHRTFEKGVPPVKTFTLSVSVK